MFEQIGAAAKFVRDLNWHGLYNFLATAAVGTGCVMIFRGHYEVGAPFVAVPVIITLLANGISNS